MINKYEDIDKAMSPNYAYQRGRQAAQLGILADKCPHSEASLSSMTQMLRKEWLKGFQIGLSDRRLRSLTQTLVD